MNILSSIIPVFFFLSVKSKNIYSANHGCLRFCSGNFQFRLISVRPSQRANKYNKPSCSKSVHTCFWSHVTLYFSLREEWLCDITSGNLHTSTCCMIWYRRVFFGLEHHNCYCSTTINRNRIFVTSQLCESGKNRNDKVHAFFTPAEVQILE